MDVDDDDEYMNAAAAHAAFVMTVSAASMYWLLRHAQHVRDMNIHKLHPLPENRNSRVRSIIILFLSISVRILNFSERVLLVLKN